MYFKNIMITTLLLLNITYAKNTIGIDINSKDIEILTSIDLNNLTDYDNSTTYTIDANYLHSSGNNMTQISFSGKNSLQGLGNLTLSLGFSSIFANNFLAFPLIAKAIYTLPLNVQIPTTSISINFAYAPSVLSFRDANNYNNFRIEADMEAISNIHLFTGYRTISTNYNYNDKTFNDSFYGGLKLSF